MFLKSGFLQTSQVRLSTLKTNKSHAFASNVYSSKKKKKEKKEKKTKKPKERKTLTTTKCGLGHLQRSEALKRQPLKIHSATSKQLNL
jgi:hypothetical protein